MKRLAALTFSLILVACNAKVEDHDRRTVAAAARSAASGSEASDPSAAGGDSAEEWANRRVFQSTNVVTIALPQGFEASDDLTVVSQTSGALAVVKGEPRGSGAALADAAAVLRLSPWLADEAELLRPGVNKLSISAPGSEPFTIELTLTDFPLQTGLATGSLYQPGGSDDAFAGFLAGPHDMIGGASTTSEGALLGDPLEILTY